MQSTKNWLANNLAIFLDWSMFRAIFLKGHMSSADVVIVIDELVQHTMQMPFVENDHMVQAFPAKCADDTFGDRILPWTSWCSRRVFQAKVSYVCFELSAKDFVVVTDNIFGYFVESKCFTKLLNSPLRVRICRNRKMPYSATIV